MKPKPMPHFDEIHIEFYDVDEMNLWLDNAKEGLIAELQEGCLDEEPKEHMRKTVEKWLS